MSLEKIKTNLKSGARPNKYMVTIPSDLVGIGTDILDILCKGASLPDATINAIQIYNQGRILPIAGDKSYTQTWDVTFYNTHDLAIRNGFEQWMKKIDDVQAHYRELENNNEYMKDLNVEQLDGKNQSTAKYKIYNAWPSVISSVDLADDAQDTVSEFTVTFSFSHWEKI